MPMEAEQLWITAVTAMPTTNASSGLETAAMKSRKAALVLRESIAALMDCMPLIRTEKASRIMPTFFWVVLRQKK